MSLWTVYCRRRAIEEYKKQKLTKLTKIIKQSRIKTVARHTPLIVLLLLGCP